MVLYLKLFSFTYLVIHKIMNVILLLTKVVKIKMFLVEYEKRFEKIVSKYLLNDEMKYFTGLPIESTKISEANSKYHSILCFSSTKLVTFFALDEGNDKFNYTSEKDSLLLRSFSTDFRYLRNGYGKEALRLLPDFVNDKYPFIKEIVLAVNSKNKPAYSLYVQSNFIDNNTRVDGKKGELIVLSYKM